MTSPSPDADLILAGGGLASGLIAMRVKTLRPDLRVLIVERSDQLGAGHTWSLFETDLPPDVLAWVRPLFVHRWPGYTVRFPTHSRRLGNAYCTVTAERFDKLVTSAVGQENVVRGADIAMVEPTSIQLGDQRVLTARAVIDARGPAGDAAAHGLKLGFQKFVGVEVDTVEPHGLTEPIVMDATVPQRDGYRFLYVLPFSPTRLLVEDTRYADGSGLDRADLADQARAYAESQGWAVARTIREEHGVLPVALAGDIGAFWRDASADGVPRAGLRSALFHPTTGYSLPDAAKLAERIAQKLAADPASLGPAMLAEEARSASMQAWKERGFFRLLNRMLFHAAAPAERYRVLQRFYRLPAPLISRFYASRLTRLDKMRILTGKPPVPIGPALSCLSEQRLMSEAA